jgi:hypothetical protein
VYREPEADAYDLQQRTRVLRRLRQRAAISDRIEIAYREFGRTSAVTG